MLPNPLNLLGSGGRIRTYDLRVMSPTSYRTAPPRDKIFEYINLQMPSQPNFIYKGGV